jgi:uncharacterized RDD family membrane protein YckC/Tfp pilus assembly major pilin PilA
MSTTATVFTPPVDQPPPAAPLPMYGGFWVRFAAHIVDGIIIGFAMIVLAFAWFMAAGLALGEQLSNLVSLGMVALGQFYHAYFVSSVRMATPGKRLCGLFVTDTDGHRLGFGRALWRNVAALFSYLTLYIGFIMAAFTPRKRALHDMLAGTVVHRQPGNSAAVAIVIVVGVFFLVVILGILAAVAIPAFQDFSVRAKVSGVVMGMSQAKAPIAAYAGENGAWPTSWNQVLPADASNPIELVPNASREIAKEIRLEQGGAIVAIVKAGQKEGQIRMTPGKVGDSIEWTCTSSPEIRKYVAESCRN